jgi:hypothetical protein
MRKNKQGHNHSQSHKDLTEKSNVICFGCEQLGHFIRKCNYVITKEKRDITSHLFTVLFYVGIHLLVLF